MSPAKVYFIPVKSKYAYFTLTDLEIVTGDALLMLDRDWGPATMVHLTVDLISKSRNFHKRRRDLSFPDYLRKLTHLHFSGKDIEDIVCRILPPENPFFNNSA